MENFLQQFKGQHIIKRTVVMLLAVIVMGIGIGFFMVAAMGSDPFSTLNLGVSSKLGLSFGTWQAIFNVILLIMVFCSDRSKLGLGTIGNMFLVGFSADIMYGFLATVVPPSEELSILSRLLFTVVGVCMQLFGISFYVTCDLGMAPYDALSYILTDRLHMPFRWLRIIMDVLCVAVGFFCGSTVGVGTLMMAFGTGPLVPIFNKYVAGPVLGTEDIHSV